MIALGWTTSKIEPPKDVGVVGPQAVRVLCANKRHAGSARARLALQVRCFDSGIDFVPITPSLVMTAQDAQRYPGIADCTRQIAAIQEVGQLTISFQTKAEISTSSASGKTWLAARRAHLHNVNERGEWLNALVSDIAIRTSAPRQQGKATICDILVKRSQVDDIKGIIANRLKHHDTPNSTCMTLTGPWPPFSFVTTPAMQEPAP